MSHYDPFLVFTPEHLLQTSMRRERYRSKVRPVQRKPRKVSKSDLIQEQSMIDTQSGLIHPHQSEIDVDVLDLMFGVNPVGVSYV